MDQLWQECETNLINKEVPPMYLLDIPFQRYLPCFNTWIVWKIKNKGSCCVLEISLLTTFLHYWTLPLSNNFRQNTRFWVLPPNHPSFNPHNKHVMLSQTPILGSQSWKSFLPLNCNSHILKQFKTEWVVNFTLSTSFSFLYKFKNTVFFKLVKILSIKI